MDKSSRGVQKYRVAMHVEGDRLTMTEEHGAFTGSGELRGEPWNWSEVTHTAKLSDGSRVEASETLMSQCSRRCFRLSEPR